MGVGGERTALAGFKIHNVVADAAAAERQRGVMRLLEQGEVDAEAFVGRFSPGNRLEHQIDGRAPADQFEGRGDMRQHAALRRNVEFGSDLIKHDEKRVSIVRAVGRRVDADDGIAGAEQKPIENTRGDAARIVGRVIGLQPYRQAARQAEGVTERSDHTAFRRHHDQILLAADLAHGSGHFRRHAGRQCGQHRRRRFIRQQPIAKAADGQM